jgi:uncharacterized membrane protein YiaA
MNGNLFLRTSMLFLLAGIVLGMVMGSHEDFTQVPVHAHLNLVGGVWMFLAGLFYNAQPNISRKAMAVHYGLCVIGIPLFAIGLWGAAIQAKWYLPFIIPGSTLSAIALIVFAVLVFVGTSRRKTA